MTAKTNSQRLPFRYLEPTFCSGLFDDPVLLVRIRPLGRNLLFDCGQIHHLAKRTLKGTEAIFISHAHMDHFMGIDTFIRNVHVTPRTFTLFGPPGLAGKLSHKLAGYDWNLTEDYWCSFRVHEIGPDTVETYLLPGPDGFKNSLEGKQPRSDKTIFRNSYLAVEAELAYHKIPVLAFRITERNSFMVDPRRLAEAGLAEGPWLKELNRRFYRGEGDGEPLTVMRRKGEEVFEEQVTDTGKLYRDICGDQNPASIGYLTDIGFTAENRATIQSFLEGVTLLICECTYLMEEREKARISYHLCTEDLNELARDLAPKFLLPMHLSKMYTGRTEELYREFDIPPEITLLKIPDRTTPRPLLPREIPRPEEINLSADDKGASNS